MKVFMLGSGVVIEHFHKIETHPSCRQGQSMGGWDGGTSPLKSYKGGKQKKERVEFGGPLGTVL